MFVPPEKLREMLYWESYGHGFWMFEDEPEYQSKTPFNPEVPRKRGRPQGTNPMNRPPKQERKVKRYCAYTKEGYVRVPYGDIDIMRYRLVAQWKLGRPLQNGEQVHHINGIKHDDRPSNLQIVTWKEHRELHNHLRKG